MVTSSSRRQQLSIANRLKEIESTRSHLLHQLKRLDAESAALQSEYKAITNSAAVISKLPNELLEAVFEMGCDAQGAEHHFEMVISHVISHWRNVALNMPRLWTGIQRASYERRLEAISAYLERSKPLTIDLKVEIGHWRANPNFPSSSDQGPDNISPLCQLLTPHLGRLRSLRVFSKSEPELPPLFACLRSVNAPFLQKIEIFCKQSYQGFHFAAPFPIFSGGTPQLGSLELTNVYLESFLPLLRSVTSICLRHPSKPTSRISSDEWNYITSFASSLVHLEIDGDALATERYSSRKVNFPFLRTLSIKVGTQMEDTTFCDFLEGVTAPRLELLALNEIASGEIDGITPFGSQFPALHTLILRENYSSYVGLEMAMEAFPDIRHILCDAMDDNYSANFRLLSSTRYWPRLHTVAIFPTSVALRLDEVQCILVNRAKCGHPLQKVYLPTNNLSEFPVGWYSGPTQIEEFTEDMEHPAWWLNSSHNC